MPYYTAPTASDVIAEVGLSPSNVNRLYTDETFTADVVKRLAMEGALVDEWLAARYDTDTLDALTTNQQVLARAAVLYRSAASVYHSAGQLNEKYRVEAEDYERRAKEMLTTLEESLNRVAESSSSGTGAATLSTAPYRIDDDGVLVVNG